MPNNQKCYMCDAEGDTAEHVPPRSFFPQGFRTNLWTVPSCAEHNNDNSLDIEYVRNVIVSHRDATGTAQDLAQSASFRSFERSAALFFRTFEHFQPVIIDGEQTATFRFDLARFTNVMETIAHAIYFKVNGGTYQGSWHVFSPTLLSQNDLQGIPDNWQRFREMMRTIPFTPAIVPVPEVFRYGTHIWSEREFAYAFEFYGGFQVFLLVNLSPPGVGELRPR